MSTRTITIHTCDRCQEDETSINGVVGYIECVRTSYWSIESKDLCAKCANEFADWFHMNFKAKDK